MVMRIIQILPAPRVGLDLSSFFADCPVFWQSKLQTEMALSTMEAKIIALSACCRELSDKVCPPTYRKTTMNVSIHEDNSGAFVLTKTLPPQFTPRSKYYAIKTIWFLEEIFKRDVQLHKIDSLEEDNGMVIPPTPNYSNVLVPVSRESVVSGHWNLNIFGFMRV